ncbi:MAG TPA: bifunctional precorrin-2 dehydrogenase/sirohydrochlorin ferrochelatase, partial [Thermodesulfovibrionales bacterium]|nr:bifunctional precorrin-2 dehydrogenase/sirohydrochlorin ferrochelatase [Thermodesulfovibrionales bacterium]
MKNGLLPPASRQYYPVFLDIADRKCIIVGGGKVAERKCMPLLAASAKVTIISPKITSVLEKKREKGLLKHISRNYRTGDLRSAFVVIVATDSEETNRRVFSDARAEGVLLNVVDNPSLCSFIVPSVLQRGALTIAVSTSGVSPAMARSVRKNLELLYGADFSKYLRFLQDTRRKVIKEVPDKRIRGLLLKELASEEILQVLMRKGFKAARNTALR